MRRIIAFLASLAMILSVTIFPVSAAKDNRYVSEEEAIALMKAQDNAIKAHGKLFESFCKGNSFEYPDYYAGEYCDGTVLHILLAQPTEENVKSIRDLLAEFENCYTIEYVKYSYNDLHNLANEVANKLSENGCEITRIYVDQRENIAVVGVASKSAVHLKDANSIPNDMLKIEELGRAVTTSTTSTTSTREDDTITARGGHWISKNNKAFTLGFMGTYSLGVTTNQRAYVTSGHEQSYSAAIYYGNSFSGTQIGTTAYINYSNNGYGDFSFINANYNAVFTNTIEYSSSSPYTYYTITGTESIPVVGQYCMYHGAASDANYYVIVDSTDTTAIYGSYNINGMVQANIISSNAYDLDGNSGAPYFRQSGSSYNIVGIHSGHVSNDSTSVFFTPWYYIAQYFTAKVS